MNASYGFSATLASFVGGWEAVFLVALILAWFGVRRLPELLTGMKRGIEEFVRATRDINEELHGVGSSQEIRDEDDTKARRDDLYLWLAQGFDVGRIPFAPGTLGSLVGVIWFVLLLVPGCLTLFVLGTIIGLIASVKCCGEAERVLGEEDPGSVVLDEIAAIPLCFAPWVFVEWWRHDAMPLADLFLTGRGLWMTVGIYVAFRVFDIWKPWPVRQSQSLPGGWGVTVDDVLAAAYVAAISLWFVL